MPSNHGGRTSLDPSQFSAPAIEEKVGWIRDAAGTRFDEIELSAQLIECAVTDRPQEHLADLADRIATVTERMGGGRIDLGQDDLRRSPIVAVGPLDEVCQKLLDTRDRYGISYFAAPIGAHSRVARPRDRAPRGELIAVFGGATSVRRRDSGSAWRSHLAEVPTHDLLRHDPQPGVAPVVEDLATGVLVGVELLGDVQVRVRVARTRHFADGLGDAHGVRLHAAP